MNQGEKQRQNRSSWWSSSEKGTNWLRAVREQIAKKSSAAPSPGVRFGVKQTKQS
ncbi:MAG: hypothetical protein ACR2P6_01890 [Gammaproteobacteria bacterium]